MEMVCGPDLDTIPVVYDHFGSKSILPIVPVSDTYIPSLIEFIEFIIGVTGIADTKKRLFEKLYNDSRFFFSKKEINWLIDKINNFDKLLLTTIIKEDDKEKKIINNDVAKSELAKVLNECPIHLNLDTCFSIQKVAQDKVYKIFYLTFEDKADSKKKYKTSIYKMTIKDGLVIRISEEFGGKPFFS